MSKNEKPPLSKKELINLHKKLKKAYNYEIIKKSNNTILAMRSPYKYPDLVNDLERTIERMDLRNELNLTHACLIGKEKTIGIDIRIINRLIEKRKEEDERIVKKLRGFLKDDYIPSIFTDKEDYKKLLRCGIKIPTSIKNLNEIWLKGILREIKIPQDISVIYIIGNDDFIRIKKEDFQNLLQPKESPEDIANKNEIINVFQSVLRGSFYKILDLNKRDFVDIKAKKDSGFINQLVVKYYTNCKINEAKEFLEIVEQMNVDVGFLVSKRFPTDVKLFSYGKKIELIRTREIEGLLI